MRLCASITLSDGKCVYPQIIDGMERILPLTLSPVEMAQYLQEEGADAIYIVNYNANNYVFPPNLNVIKQISDSVKIPVYCNGNVTSIKDIDLYLNVGIKRLVLDLLRDDNSKLLKDAFKLFDADAFAGQIKSKNGMIMYQSALGSKNFNLISTILEYEKMGMKYIVFDDYTSITNKEDPDFINIHEITSCSDLRLIYSGRAKSKEQIKTLHDLGVYSCLLSYELNEYHMNIREIRRTFNKNMELS